MKKIGTPHVDYTGNVFGKLTVLKYVGSGKWDCQCQCGNVKSILSSSLVLGRTISCGCHKSAIAKSQKPTHDLTGMKFGRLTVLGPGQRTGNGRFTWQCHCVCGRIAHAFSSHLRNGHVQSCGCYKNECQIGLHVVDLTGQTFGRLTVVRLHHRRSDNKWIWECRCECGNTAFATSYEVRTGDIKSCGCDYPLLYDNHRFRSKWEIFWYIAAMLRGHNVEFEPIRIPICINGKDRIYIPDFRFAGTEHYVEIRATRNPVNMIRGLSKYNAACAIGYHIDLTDQHALQDWCGLTIDTMYKYYARGGPDVVREQIEIALKKYAA